MKPDPRFLNLPKDFWANVRLISQEVGYTIKDQGQIRVPSLDEIQKAFDEISLDSGHLADKGAIRRHMEVFSLSISRFGPRCCISTSSLC